MSMFRFMQGLIVATLMLLLAASGGAGFDDHGRDQVPEYEYFVTDSLAEGVLPSGIAWALLLDDVNVGDEQVRLAELTFEAGRQGEAHSHGAVEIFYVLSGRFIHEVNGEARTLSPGQIGIVRPGDRVAHGVAGADPARVLTIWVPGGADAPFHRVLHDTAD